MDHDVDPLAAIPQSFYSADLYRRVAASWRSMGIAYLLLILTLCWIPSMIKLHLQMSHGLQTFQKQLWSQVPTIRFENGQVITPENRPYIISFGGAKNPLVLILDTSGHFKSLDGERAQFLITRHRMFIRQQSGEIRMYDLSQSHAKPFVFNQARVGRVLHPLKYWALAALYATIFLLSVIKRLIQAFFMALIGMIIVAILKSDLDLGALLSVAIVSMTPAMVIETLIGVTGKSIPHLWILWALLLTGYFLFALNAASDKTPDIGGA